MVSIAQHTAEEKVWKILNKVSDPEVPVLSVVDLGIIRSVKVEQLEDGEHIHMVITPTYTGCPAMDVISMNIRLALIANDYKHIDIQTALSPAWTTDWMSEEGKSKLKLYGIAPPYGKQKANPDELFSSEENVQCPQCGSWLTHRISEFGSTACKSLYQCDVCKEPFDYFKCH